MITIQTSKAVLAPRVTLWSWEDGGEFHCAIAELPVYVKANNFPEATPSLLTSLKPLIDPVTFSEIEGLWGPLKIRGVVFDPVAPLEWVAKIGRTLVNLRKSKQWSMVVHGLKPVMGTDLEAMMKTCIEMQKEKLKLKSNQLGIRIACNRGNVALWEKVAER